MSEAPQSSQLNNERSSEPVPFENESPVINPEQTLSAVEEIAKGLENVEAQLQNIPDQIRRAAETAAEAAAAKVLEEFARQQGQTTAPESTSQVHVMEPPVSNNPARYAELSGARSTEDANAHDAARYEEYQNRNSSEDDILRHEEERRIEHGARMEEVIFAEGNANIRRAYQLAQHVAERRANIDSRVLRGELLEGSDEAQQERNDISELDSRIAQALDEAERDGLDRDVSDFIMDAAVESPEFSAGDDGSDDVDEDEPKGDSPEESDPDGGAEAPSDDTPETAGDDAVTAEQAEKAVSSRVEEIMAAANARIDSANDAIAEIRQRVSNEGRELTEDEIAQIAELQDEADDAREAMVKLDLSGSIDRLLGMDNELSELRREIDRFKAGESIDSLKLIRVEQLQVERDELEAAISSALKEGGAGLDSGIRGKILGLSAKYSMLKGKIDDAKRSVVEATDNESDESKAGAADRRAQFRTEAIEKLSEDADEDEIEREIAKREKKYQRSIGNGAFSRMRRWFNIVKTPVERENYSDGEEGEKEFNEDRKKRRKHILGGFAAAAAIAAPLVGVGIVAASRMSQPDAAEWFQGVADGLGLGDAGEGSIGTPDGGELIDVPSGEAVDSGSSNEVTAGDMIEVETNDGTLIEVPAFGDYEPVTDPPQNISTPIETVEDIERAEMTEPLVFAEHAEAYSEIHEGAGFMDGMTEDEFKERCRTDPEFYEMKYNEIADWKEEKGIDFETGTVTGDYMTSGKADVDGDGDGDLITIMSSGDGKPVLHVTSTDPEVQSKIDELGLFVNLACNQMGIMSEGVVSESMTSRPIVLEEVINEEEHTPPATFENVPIEPDTPVEPTEPTVPVETETPEKPEEPVETPEKPTEPPKEPEEPVETPEEPEVPVEEPEEPVETPEEPGEPEAPEVPEVVPKVPEKDVNDDPGLYDPVEMGDETVDEGPHKPSDPVTDPPAENNPVTYEPSQETAQGANETPPEEREEDVEQAKVPNDPGTVFDQSEQQELVDTGQGGLDTDSEGNPIGNDGRVDR